MRTFRYSGEFCK